MKFKLLFIALIFNAHFINAQKKNKIELNTGTNVINRFNISTNNETGSKYIKKFGFQIGLHAERIISEHFAMGFGADFSKYRYNLESIEYDFYFGGNNDTKVLIDFKESLSYLQVPIFIEYSLLKGSKINPYISISYTGNLKIKTKSELFNYRFNKENLNSQEELYKDSFLDYIKISNKEMFEKIDEVNKYSGFVSLSTGTSINIKKDFYAGINFSLYFNSMPLKYSNFGFPTSANVFFGIKI